MKYAQIIVGAGYGDEGKGLMTDYFCNISPSENTVVVRYNGGAQAGHTVVLPNGKKHVFHHFGSGSFTNAATYLSEQFIVNPVLFNQEYKLVSPKVYVHPSCRVTTPYDMVLNQLIERARPTPHGSCGVGIYETILRHQHVPLDVDTVTSPHSYELVLQKLNDIKEYSIARANSLNLDDTELQYEYTDRFLTDLKQFAQSINSVRWLIPIEYDYIVFEGAQGLLLSEKHGKLPHLTPSDPGIEWPLEICNRNGINMVNVCYVTRCYSTRHGNGPLLNESTVEQLGITLTDETNITNEFQGSFRVAPLDINSIRNAILNDFYQSTIFNGNVTAQLAVTCLDQISNSDKILADIQSELGILSGFGSRGPTRDDIYRW